MRWLAVVALLLQLGLGCKRPPVVVEETPVSEGRKLLDEGRLDSALATLETSDDPESLFLQARVWMKKAERSTVRSTAPAQDGASLKPEEAKALALLERVLTAQPTHAGAHLALANLLRPYAEEEASHSGASKTRASRKPPSPDPIIARVLSLYEQAIKLDASNPEPARGLAQYARGIGDLSAAEKGYQERIQREKESATPHAAYGDFLIEDAKRPEAAIEEYRQALIWQPNDAAIQGKLLTIFMNIGREHMKAEHFASAEEAFREARQYITDPRGLPAQELAMYEKRLGQVRGRDLGSRAF